MQILSLIILVSILLVISVFVFLLSFDVLNNLKGYAPNLSSTKKDIENITSIYQFEKGQKVADYGAGIGKILWKLKDEPIKLVGYEINPLLYIYLKYKFRENKNVEIKKKDFLQTDPWQYDVIVIYGMDKVMGMLEEKIEDTKPSTKKKLTIISNRFVFDENVHQKRKGRVYLYEF